MRELLLLHSVEFIFVQYRHKKCHRNDSLEFLCITRASWNRHESYFLEVSGKKVLHIGYYSQNHHLKTQILMLKTELVHWINTMFSRGRPIWVFFKADVDNDLKKRLFADSRHLKQIIKANIYTFKQHIDSERHLNTHCVQYRFKKSMKL